MTHLVSPTSGARLTVFSGYFDSHGGGMEIATAELVEQLRETGATVEWISMADGIPRPHPDDRPLAGTDAIYRFSGVPLPLPALSSLRAIWRATQRADLVIAVEVNFLFSALGYAFAKRQRKPVMLIQHVGVPSTVSRIARIVMNLGERIVVKPAVRGANTVVAVSPLVGSYLRRCRPDIEVIGHALDLSLFRPAKEELEKRRDRKMLVGREKDTKDQEFWACYVGRLTPSKGIGVILPLAKARPDWTFVIAGTGPIDVSCWNQPNIVALGQLSREDVARLYRVSEAVIQPSQSESYSLVVREALACGAQVICSPQILETDPGLAPYLTLVEVDLSDEVATAARFSTALSKPKRWSIDLVRAYLADMCGPNATIKRYVTVIETLLKRSRRARQ